MNQPPEPDLTPPPGQAQGHGPENAIWVRHRDFYVEQGMAPGVPTVEVTEAELRRGHWGWIRSMASILLSWLLRGYRKVISPLYGQVCSFYPSCSAYGLEAVTAHGVIRGIPLTLWRILRCNPFTGGGVDPVPPTARIWPQGGVPTIIETNHPPIPRGDDD
ncbi:membrane protein insertion efficiency factor YidD [Nesterenkonia aurantiaca]|uniref:membrane protein insertion efficiency factor YidD n=1 Tax=Nesterenkonia aurantiaca TaxID=1436010 RepID=UPI003EE496E5